MFPKLLLILASHSINTRSVTSLSELNNFDPKFSGPINNVTVPVGRDAMLTCAVYSLNNYKIAWLRVDTQTILTIHNHVLTKNQRITISHTEYRIWQLRIRDVKESDRGWYMCQINTDPMKSQVGYLDVVVPPDIVDYQSSADMLVEVGGNVTFTCTAKGLPKPSITWRRESDLILYKKQEKRIYSWGRQNLTLWQVQPQQAGGYLCIASNGVPPSVSKRVTLLINYPPIIWTRYHTIYLDYGQSIKLECISESYPISHNYWLKDSEFIQEGTFETVKNAYNFKVVMSLTIGPMKAKDFGDYKCVAKNPMGLMEQSIKLYRKSKHILNHLYQTSHRNNQLIVIEEFITNAGEGLNRIFNNCYLTKFLLLLTWIVSLIDMNSKM